MRLTELFTSRYNLIWNLVHGVFNCRIVVLSTMDTRHRAYILTESEFARKNCRP